MGIRAAVRTGSRQLGVEPLWGPRKLSAVKLARKLVKSSAPRYTLYFLQRNGKLSTRKRQLRNFLTTLARAKKSYSIEKMKKTYKQKNKSKSYLRNNPNLR